MSFDDPSAPSFTSHSSSSVSIQKKKLTEYAALVENVLKPQLVSAEQLVARTQREIRDYQELGQTLQQLQLQQPTMKTANDDDDDDNKPSTVTATTTTTPSSTMVDLGYQTVFCNATIPSPDRLLVHVGMGFHVELSILKGEAQVFVAKRIHYLQTTRLKPQQQKLAELYEHIHSATLLLTQLQQQQELAAGGNDNNSFGQ